MLKKIGRGIVRVLHEYRGALESQGIKKFAYRGDVDAQYHLGCLYETGTLTVEKDLAAACFYFRLSAEKGHQEAKDKAQLLEATLPRSMLNHVQKCLDNADGETVFFPISMRELRKNA